MKNKIYNKTGNLGKVFLTIFSLSGLAINSNAALIAGFTETFTGGGGGTADTSVYTLSSSTTSSFTLQSGVTDGSLFDGADDGYAHLNRTATSSATQTVVGAFGTVDIGDVGSVITIDAEFRHDVGMTTTWSILVGGANIGSSGDQSVLVASSFSSGNITNDTNFSISSTPTGTANGARTVGALTYTITNADVGQTLGFQVASFDSTNNGTGEGNRDLFIDSIAYSVSVPEPSSVALLTLGVVGFCGRRQRRK